jgi:hypothetical protein
MALDRSARGAGLLKQSLPAEEAVLFFQRLPWLRHRNRFRRAGWRRREPSQQL